MLKYLISTTELLITAAIGIGLILGYIRLSYSARNGKIAVIAGICAGFLSGGVMSFMKNGYR